MHPIAFLLAQTIHVADFLLMLYEFAIFFYVILSWLLMLRIIKNPLKPFFRTVNWQKIYIFLQRIIEPALRKLRPYMPKWLNIDWSILALFILVGFARYSLNYYALKWLY